MGETTWCYTIGLPDSPVKLTDDEKAKLRSDLRGMSLAELAFEYRITAPGVGFLAPDKLNAIVEELDRRQELLDSLERLAP